MSQRQGDTRTQFSTYPTRTILTYWNRCHGTITCDNHQQTLYHPSSGLLYKIHRRSCSRRSRRPNSCQISTFGYHLSPWSTKRNNQWQRHRIPQQTCRRTGAHLPYQAYQDNILSSSRKWTDRKNQSDGQEYIIQNLQGTQDLGLLSGQCTACSKDHQTSLHGLQPL